jgi:hypothetical protein
MSGLLDADRVAPDWHAAIIAILRYSLIPMRVSYPILILSLLAMVSCSTSPPKNLSDSCEIFEDKSGWYRDASKAYERWGTPIHVQLAIIYQESKFVDDAKPPRDYLLWVIPWGRVSSAYGYAQAQDSTWDWYREKSGNRGADRDDFDDAVDFVSWYGSVSHQKLGISQWDAYNQYLAYHEGHGGFQRKTYEGKPWLLAVAKKVSIRAANYQAQLSRCEDDLDAGWSFWPF